MLRVLTEAPERWTKISSLSRRPPAIPDGLPTQAKHIALDFLSKPEDIAMALKEQGVQSDCIFLYSYVQAKPKEGGGLWSDAEEMCRVNCKPVLQKSPLTIMMAMLLDAQLFHVASMMHIGI